MCVCVCVCVGDLNKLVLEFGAVFWCDEDMFGCVREEASVRGRLYMFWNVHRINGAPILVCLLSGDSAHAVEELDDERGLVEEAMGLLRRMFGAEAPYPTRSFLTRWGRDPLARGSYSFVAVGATEQGQPHTADAQSDDGTAACPHWWCVCVCVWCGVSEYVSLSLPVSSRCFFAGEACNRYYPATVHGAILSGYWAAGSIQDTFHASTTRTPHCTQPTGVGHSEPTPHAPPLSSAAVWSAQSFTCAGPRRWADERCGVRAAECRGCFRPALLSPHPALLLASQSSPAQQPLHANRHRTGEEGQRRRAGQLNCTSNIALRCVRPSYHCRRTALQSTTAHSPLPSTACTRPSRSSVLGGLTIACTDRSLTL